MRRALVIVSILASLPAAPARARSTAGAAAGRGHVRFATARRAYLDAGKRHGLHVGDVVKLSHNGRAAGECKIDNVAESTASCVGDARAGDTFALPSGAAPSSSAPPPAPAPPPTVDAAATSAALAAAPVDKVDFKAPPRAAAGALPLVRVTLGHSAWITFGGAQFEQEHLDLALDGLSLRFGGFRAYAQLTALVYTVRPALNRFRPSDRFQLYVWDVEASSREVGRAFALSVGRIWTHHAPGMPLIDGAQGGWRSRDGSVEVGAVGGTVPDAITLYPTGHYAAGFYYGATHARKNSDLLRLVRHEARLMLRDTVANGPRLELEALAQAWLGRFLDLGAQARATLGAGHWSMPDLEAARVSIGLRPLASLRGSLNFRYVGALDIDPDNFAMGTFATGSWYYADADIAYQPSRHVSITMQGGAAEQAGATLIGREWAGLELAFPTLLKRAGVLSVGYREELGWLAGRMADIQLSSTLLDRLRVLARLSYFEDRPSGSALVSREIGATIFSDVRIVRWLAVRLSAMSRFDLGEAVAGGGLPRQVAGLIARVDLAGQY